MSSHSYSPGWRYTKRAIHGTQENTFHVFTQPQKIINCLVEQDYYEHDTLQQKLDVLNELKTNGFDSWLFKENHIYESCARHPPRELV